jgi:hypothetical protein
MIDCPVTGDSIFMHQSKINNQKFADKTDHVETAAKARVGTDAFVRPSEGEAERP